MGRKTWVKPMTLVQKFEANEPVAAIGQCYQIKCKSTAKADRLGKIKPRGGSAPEFHWSHEEGYYDSALVEGGLSPDFVHDNCTNPSKNVFNVDLTNPAAPVINYIVESGGIAKDGAFEHWLDYNNSGVFDSGDIIYWTNTTGGRLGTRWNHWGEVASVDSSRPLHS